MSDLEWIRESNLIEDIDNRDEDMRSLDAWKWLSERKWTPCMTILALHRRIMVGLNPQIAGKWRSCQVWVGNYQAPPASDVSEMMSAWANFIPLKEENIRQQHITFEKIHPFVDGNGRTGRMLMNWQRVRAGLEPLCIKASERWAYYKWFSEE